MPRTLQSARCSHSGPPCAKCFRTKLTNAVYSGQSYDDFYAKDAVSTARRNHAFESIDLQVEAAKIVNDGKDNLFSRETCAVVDVVMAETKCQYEKALAKGVDKVSARAEALERVPVAAELHRARYVRQREIDSIPENYERNERQRRRSEQREAGPENCLTVTGGEDALQNPAVQNLLGRCAGYVADSIREVLVETSGVELRVQVIFRPNSVHFEVNGPDGNMITSGTTSR